MLRQKSDEFKQRLDRKKMKLDIIATTFRQNMHELDRILQSLDTFRHYLEEFRRQLRRIQTEFGRNQKEYRLELKNIEQSKTEFR